MQHNSIQLCYFSCYSNSTILLFRQSFHEVSPFILFLSSLVIFFLSYTSLPQSTLNYPSLYVTICNTWYVWPSFIFMFWCYSPVWALVSSTTWHHWSRFHTNIIQYHVRPEDVKKILHNLFDTCHLFLCCVSRPHNRFYITVK